MSRESDEPGQTAPLFSSADFWARASRRLLQLDRDELPVWGDHAMSGLSLDPGWRATTRAAAVLIPVVMRASEATVLLTQRASALRDHSGQIAFPGGKIDQADASPVAAALREAQEEIGLDPACVTPAGYLDLYVTGSGFHIAPVVAEVRPSFTLTLNPREVDDAFEVPLGFLMNAANHERHQREWRGALRHYYAMPYNERRIWGITAGILRNLYDRLYA